MVRGMSVASTASIEPHGVEPRLPTNEQVVSAACALPARGSRFLISRQLEGFVVETRLPPCREAIEFRLSAFAALKYI